MGKDRETFGQVFFLRHHFFRQLQLGGSEIPNALDARPHHHLGSFLSRRSWNGQHAQQNFPAADKGNQLGDRLDFAAVNPLATLFGSLSNAPTMRKP